MTQRELKQRIMDDPDLTRDEKAKLLNALRVPYVKMSDEELLQLVQERTAESRHKEMLFMTASSRRGLVLGTACSSAPVPGR